MKKVIFILSLFVTTSILSQDYTTAIGLRGGLSNGVTVKHFISGNSALEGILSTRWRGFNITGLYEINNALPEPGLNWYYGGGAHIGFWSGYNRHPWFKDDRAYTVVGVDGILGIEYNFIDIPLNLSLDWKPAFNLVGYSGLWMDNFALSVRYLIR